MNTSQSLQKLTNFVVQSRTTILSSRNLLQIHSQLITTGLYSDSSCFLSLLNLSLANPSTLGHAIAVFSHPQTPNIPSWPLFIHRLDLDAAPFRVFSLFEAVQRVKGNNPVADPFVYASLTKACDKLLRFREGMSIHCRAVRIGLDRNVNLLNSFIHLYMGSKGLMRYARLLFDGIPERTVVTLNCMISGFLKNGQFNLGLGLFTQVQSSSSDLTLKPNYVTLVILISGCVEFAEYIVGKSLHSYGCRMGMCSRNEIHNALINLYSKSGHMDDAEKLFSEVGERDLVSWNTMIAGYAKSENCRKAFSLFKEMGNEDIVSDRVSFISLILACANSRNLDGAKVVHGFLKVRGTEINDSLGVMLIKMYSKCGSIECAWKVFNDLSDKSIASWNSLIHAYVECKQYTEAMELFDLMKSRRLKPDEVTMLGLISACRNLGELHHGIEIHSFIENNDNLKGSIVLLNALIDMYAKCGNMMLAKTTFHKMPKRDVFSWTSIIVGHAINSEGEEALTAFRQMSVEKVEPNSVTFLGLLLACDHAGIVHEGRNLFDLMCKAYNIEPMIEHYGCVVDMYARGGMLEEAHNFVKNMPVEPNSVIWRMLINACRVHGHVDLGLSYVSGLTDAKISSAEDNVIFTNVFAEAGRWDDVLHTRSSMAIQKTEKEAGRSLISSLVDRTSYICGVDQYFSEKTKADEQITRVKRGHLDPAQEYHGLILLLT